MRTKEFSSLTDFALHLASLPVALSVASHKALDKIGRLVEKDAKDQIGSYQAAIGEFPAWAPLTTATQADRVRQGYSADDPLLRDGTLRRSIEHEVSGDSVVVGSKLDIAAFQEFGTKTIPPRPFIGPAAVKAKDHVERVFGEAFVEISGYGDGVS